MKVVSDCSRKCFMGHCINDLSGFHEQTGYLETAQMMRGRGSLHTWIFLTYVLHPLHICSRANILSLSLAGAQMNLLNKLLRNFCCCSVIYVKRSIRH